MVRSFISLIYRRGTTTKRNKDGRHFAMHSSRRKVFRGVRKVSTCQGNFQSMNDACHFFIESGKRNSHQFSTIDSHKFCFTSNSMAVILHCAAVKCIEYNKAVQLLEVFHLGEHACEPKPLQQMKMINS